MKKILEGHYLSCLQTNYWGTCLLCPPVSAPEDSAQYYIFCERLTTRPVTFTLASIPHCQCQLCKILFCRRRDKRSNNEKYRSTAETICVYTYAVKQLQLIILRRRLIFLKNYYVALLHALFICYRHLLCLEKKYINNTIINK